MRYDRELRQISHLLRLTAELLVQIARDDEPHVERLEHLAVEVDVLADRLMRMVDNFASGAAGRDVA